MKNLMKDLQTAGLGIAGALGAKVVKNKVLPMIPGVGTNEYLKDIAPIALGLFMMRQKNVMLQDAGLGMIIGAGADFAAAKIPGIGEITGDDVSAVADAVIMGLNEEINEALEMNGAEVDDVICDDNEVSEELSEEMMDDLGEELSEELSEEMGEELAEEYN